MSGSDAIGIVTIWLADDATVSSATWNGVALTALANSPQVNGGPSKVYGFYIVGPTTGVIAATASASVEWNVSCAYYTGGNATQPDAQDVFANSSTMSLTSDVTVVDADSWVVMMGRDNFGTSITPSTNCTSRGEEVNGTFLYDSNGVAGAAGAYSQTVTDANNAYISGFQVSIAPAGAAAVRVPPRRMLRGIGQ